MVVSLHPSPFPLRSVALLPALPDVFLRVPREVEVQTPVRLPLGDRGHFRPRDTPHRSGGGETANFATLMARAENVEERHRDDAVDAAGQFIGWQAWWSERMQENSTEEWKQKRMRSFGKRLKLQKKGKLLLYDKELEHVQRALDETRLAEWKVAEALGSRRDLCSRGSAFGLRRC